MTEGQREEVEKHGLSIYSWDEFLVLVIPFYISLLFTLLNLYIKLLPFQMIQPYIIAGGLV